MKRLPEKPCPFLYGVTVSSKDFADREEDRKKLYKNLVGGINTTLISPRRWGKSSLVEKVIETINSREKNIKTVSIDLFSVETEEEFLESFAKELIKAASNKWQDWVEGSKSFFKHLIPKVSIGVNPEIDFSLSFNWQDAMQHKDEILNLPQVIAEKKNIRFVICLDEFQNLSVFSGYQVLEKKMRACWQRQKLVTYCLLGSKCHMMADIFNNPSKPFYRFGDVILLQKIREDKWLDFIVEKFKSSGKSITKEVAVLIPQLMKNHSWYVQQFAHYVWQKTYEEVTVDIMNTALSEIIYANMPFFQREIEGLSVSQINFLKAVVKGETQMTSQAVMAKYRMGTPRNVLKNKEKLMYLDIVDYTHKKYELLDPVFELWFAKQYFGKDFKIIPDE